MAVVEVLYPFGGARRGDRVTVPDDKVGALRRLHWAREVPPAAAVEAAAARPKVRRKVVEKESGIDAVLSEKTEA
jgi:hypothetical protein